MIARIKGWSKKKKIIVGIVVGVFALALIGSLVGPLAENSTDPQATTEPKVLTAEEELYNKLVKLLGEYTNRKDDAGKKVKKVHYIEFKNDEVLIQIGADDNLTSNMRLGYLHYEIIKIMKNINFDRNVYLQYTFSVLDENFNAKETIVLHFKLNKNRIENINWDNVRDDHIPTIADYYWKWEKF